MSVNCVGTIEAMASRLQQLKTVIPKQNGDMLPGQPMINYCIILCTSKTL